MIAKTFRRARTRFAVLAAGAAALILVMTGCAAASDGPSPAPAAGSESSRLMERTITLTNGETVTCVIYSAGGEGGLSCDWSER